MKREPRNLGSLPVEAGLGQDTGYLLDLLTEKLQHGVVGVGLDAQVVAGAITVGNRTHDPVDVAPQKVQQLPTDYGYFSRVDTIGAEKRTAAAFGTLEKVVKQILEHIVGEFSAASDLTKDLSCGGEFASID